MVKSLKAWFTGLFAPRARAQGLYDEPTAAQVERLIAAAKGEEYTPPEEAPLYSKPTYSQFERLIAAVGASSESSGGKADRPSQYTVGNLAKFDANGNPTDSGMNRDGNGNLDATEFTFTPAQVADYDSASVGTVISKADTPVVLHGGQHYVVRKSFVKTNGGWDADSVAGRVVLPGASGTGSTALGDATQAIGSGAVSTGKNTKASGAGALSSGQETDAAGTGAHAEGQSTSATATCAHSEGYFTIAQNQSEHAQGEYNASHTGATASEKTLNSIGIGDSNGRKNAVEVMRDGKVFVLGLGRYVGTNPTNSTDLASAVNAKAGRPSKYTAGNLAEFDVQGNPADSGVQASDKLASTSAAPKFSADSAVQYVVDSRCVYNGKLYKCVAPTTGGTWAAESWAEDTMTDPDAVLDITAQKQLRVVAKGGALLWAQGYDLAAESSTVLSCDRGNLFVFEDGATSQTFTLPTAASGKVGDFGLDVDNSANTVAGAIAFTGTLGAAYDMIVREGESLADLLTVPAGKLAQFNFTLTAFGTAAKPAWRVMRDIVEREQAAS